MRPTPPVSFRWQLQASLLSDREQQRTTWQHWRGCLTTSCLGATWNKARSFSFVIHCSTRCGEAWQLVVMKELTFKTRKHRMSFHAYIAVRLTSPTTRTPHNSPCCGVWIKKTNKQTSAVFFSRLTSACRTSWVQVSPGTHHDSLPLPFSQAMYIFVLCDSPSVQAFYFCIFSNRLRALPGSLSIIKFCYNNPWTPKFSPPDRLLLSILQSAHTAVLPSTTWGSQLFFNCWWSKINDLRMPTTKSHVAVAHDVALSTEVWAHGPGFHAIHVMHMQTTSLHFAQSLSNEKWSTGRDVVARVGSGSSKIREALHSLLCSSGGQSCWGIV